MKIKLTRFAFLLAVLAMAVAASCVGHSRHWNSLDLAESIIVEHPDSALAIIDSIDVAELRGSEEKARHALLMSMALDKCWIDTTAFDALQPAIDYYPRHGSPDDKLRTYYYQGRIYQNRNEMDSAMRCFLRAGEYIAQAKDTLTAANLLVAEGVIFYNAYKFDEYIKANLEAAALYDSVGHTAYEISCLAGALSGCNLKQS